MKLKDLLKILDISVFKIGNYELLVKNPEGKVLQYNIKADNNNKLIILEVSNNEHKD